MGLNPAKNPLQVPAGLLGGDQRSIFGSITGTPYDNKKSAEFQSAGEREAAH
ncbi:hypothetical protein [Snodgrassella sp. CFCC 13594]|uniref:hypothetical protein n=1 Tax=Snodgrassella sp. CFCC 13594 TaxID=1775559 RepID=UPI000A8CC23E|nr:hypothetical protein [Snodgrassella sp. CFCC 13594]